MTDRSTPSDALPGKWGRIRLELEVATSRSIRKMLDEATNRRDGLATTRAELRTRFQKAADSAREGGATDFYVAFKLTSTSLADDESEMLELFDAIVRTTRWPAPALIPMEVSP